MDKDTVVTLLKYKRWIDLATLQAIRAIDGTVHGEKRHLTIRLMNHIHVVDMIFRANLRGRPHGYTALNTPETPTVDELETAMTAYELGALNAVTETEYAALQNGLDRATARLKGE